MHDALLEYIESGDTEIAASSITQGVLDLQQVQESGTTKLQQQYRVLNMLNTFTHLVQTICTA